MKIRILDIGQCGFDGPRLEELWNEELGARATRAGDAAEAGQHLHRDTFDVILVKLRSDAPDYLANSLANRVGRCQWPHRCRPTMPHERPR